MHKSILYVNSIFKRGVTDDSNLRAGQQDTARVYMKTNVISKFEEKTNV